MAFHVSCPITCRRICYCELGFAGGLRSEKARRGFLEEIEVLEEFLRDPWIVRPGGAGDSAAQATVQVLVPKVEPAPVPVAYGGGDGDDAYSASAHAKRLALQRQAVAASLAAENYARKMEVVGAADSLGEPVLGEQVIDHARDDQGSTVKVMCRLCFSGENEGSDRALKMLSCQSCNKKYHRRCLRSWAEYRDLFHWSSWVCASCRICEVCRRAGDPNKLMYCKRCDGAYHCYCQQPPHKNVNHGPYLCSKHTRCHSCGSTVPGSGPSTRWFLGYTCCDACGRLFVKGNYCPVCLKVYRDSETTPMVCCDICERWVHIVCDGISDEKYQQFQTDQNLQYVCAACRGDCYQVKDIDDAVRELWNRRDEADRSLITSLRAAAGLPTEEATFSTLPYSEDESNGPTVHRNVHGRFLKFSVKGLSDKSAKAFKDSGKTSSKNLTSSKKPVKKKEWQIKFVSKADGLPQNPEVEHGAMSLKNNLNDSVHDDLKSCRADGQESFSSPSTEIAGDAAAKFSDAKTESNNDICGNEVLGDPSDRVIKIQNKQLSDSHFKECAGKNSSKSETVKGTKLVIHIGGRNRNVTSSPMSESSSCQREQDLSTLNGSEFNSLGKMKNSKNGFSQAQIEGVNVDGEGTKQYNTNQTSSSKHGDKHKNVIKLGKVSDMHRKNNGNIVQESVLRNSLRSPVFGKKGAEVDLVDEEARLRNDETVPGKQPVKHPVLPNLEYGNNDILPPKPISGVPSERPLLKLKFKNPYFEQKSSWASHGEEENSVKGHRSKRKRPFVEKNSSLENQDLPKQHHEHHVDEAVDANWILRKLGKDAIGKRVEVQQRSGDSWKRGVVSNLIEGTSSLSVHFDDGRSRTLELGNQRVRFIPQKHKKLKT
ncbi:hypothetical protein KFK09_009084 [Dendrobium nobile]|uniref:PHD-type domain-containing protein n=1 Tax=Dendrobium nobile TaxID=94219 RepID=A0A8T3BPG1_DENNO|nr:hypothetical protein KFK09_009084 [Dendrobium nobile]